MLASIISLWLYSLPVTMQLAAVWMVKYDRMTPILWTWQRTSRSLCSDSSLVMPAYYIYIWFRSPSSTINWNWLAGGCDFLTVDGITWDQDLPVFLYKETGSGKGCNFCQFDSNTRLYYMSNEHNFSVCISLKLVVKQMFVDDMKIAVLRKPIFSCYCMWACSLNCYDVLVLMFV